MNFITEWEARQRDQEWDRAEDERLERKRIRQRALELMHGCEMPWKQAIALAEAESTGGAEQK